MRHGSAATHARERPLKKFALVLLALLLGIQLIRTERTNPPSEAQPHAPSAALEVLRRACYDCHSHETIWPWYSGVAPVSWLIARDVREAREHMNFSMWTSLSRDEMDHTMHEIWEEVEAGRMPPWYYVRMHPEAELSPEDRSALRAWIKPQY